MEVLRRSLCRDCRLRIICLKMFSLLMLTMKSSRWRQLLGSRVRLWPCCHTRSRTQVLLHLLLQRRLRQQAHRASNTSHRKWIQAHSSAASVSSSTTSSSSEQQETEKHLPADLLQDDRFMGKFSFNEVSMCLHIETEIGLRCGKRDFHCLVCFFLKSRVGYTGDARTVFLDVVLTI